MLFVNQTVLAKLAKIHPKTLARWRKEGLYYVKHKDDKVSYEKDATLKFVAWKKPYYLDQIKKVFEQEKKK